MGKKQTIQTSKKLQKFSVVIPPPNVIGIQGLGIAETAYQNSLAYANEKEEGKANNNKENKTDLIIKHADIRRSLLNMKSIIEGQEIFSILAITASRRSLNHDNRANKKRGERSGFFNDTSY